MPNVNSPETASYILQILVSAFLAILFLQSGIDKVVDRRGNREYLDQHFAKSPLAGTVGPMFAVITILEISAGALSGMGCVVLILTRDPTVAFLGAVRRGDQSVRAFPWTARSEGLRRGCRAGAVLSAGDHRDLPAG